MRFALFVGCTIPARVRVLESSARAVLSALGISVEDLPFGCCGYPARRFSASEHIVLAARALALAGSHDLPILTLCDCCYGSLCAARSLLLERSELMDSLKPALRREGLLPRVPEVRHLLSLLAKEIGMETIRERVRVPLRDMKVAAHYGCHALRPSSVVNLDNPHAPSVFESILRTIGAEVIDWPRRLDCCGAPITDDNIFLSLRMMHAKVADAKESGAYVLAMTCPHCYLHFQSAKGLRIVLLTQLLGLAFGVEPDAIGFFESGPGERKFS